MMCGRIEFGFRRIVKTVYSLKSISPAVGPKTNNKQTLHKDTHTHTTREGEHTKALFLFGVF